jgi:ATP-binding cassette, subfamily B, bacterial MsbA
MHSQLPQQLGNLLKATSFWQDNYLILREFKHFRKIAILALIFSILAATFEVPTLNLSKQE